MRQVDSISIIRVLRTSAGLFVRNLLPFVLLGLIIRLPALPVYLAGIAPSGALLFGRILCTALLQGIYGRVVFQMLDSSRPRLVSQAGMAFRSGTPTLLAAPLVVFGVSLGGGLMAAPALYLLSATEPSEVFAIPLGILGVLPLAWLGVVFWPTVSVVAIEQDSSIGPVRRSIELTKEQRGRLFGLMVILFVGLSVVQGIQMALGPLMAILAFDMYISTGESPRVLMFVAWVLLAPDWLFSIFVAVVGSVVYYDLRSIKDRSVP